MKKKICFLMLCMLFLCGGKVFAVESTCSYSEQAELNSKFANIKITYEDVETIYDGATDLPVAPEDVDPEKAKIKSETDGYYTLHNLKISVLNMPESLYAIVTNDVNDDERIISFSDAKDGVVSFTESDELTAMIVNYTFTFYASDTTECAGDNYGTKNLVSPRFNRLSSQVVCQENPGLEACNTYVTYPDEGEKGFYALVDSQLSKKDTSKEDKTETGNTITDYLKEHKEVVLVSLGALVVIGGAIAIIKKARSKRGAL